MLLLLQQSRLIQHYTSLLCSSVEASKQYSTKGDEASKETLGKVKVLRKVHSFFDVTEEWRWAWKQQVIWEDIPSSFLSFWHYPVLFAAIKRKRQVKHHTKVCFREAIKDHETERVCFSNLIAEIKKRLNIVHQSLLKWLQNLNWMDCLPYSVPNFKGDHLLLKQRVAKEGSLSLWWIKQ